MPEHQSDIFVIFTVTMEILLEPTSNKLLVGDVGDSIWIDLMTLDINLAAKPCQGDSLEFYLIRAVFILINGEPWLLQPYSMKARNRKLPDQDQLNRTNVDIPGIEASDPYSIVDEPRLRLIYLNNKEEKRVMDLLEIVKFCDATLEKVLKEIKLKIFETEFLKKALLLGDLDLKIMKAYKREITKRLRHHEQMRRWESLVNEGDC
uniref:Uncharacterized protein n=1 Tax=Tanacetum cinerariifolium TaxID=118510 RepID=A0A6L2NTG3_TANCI|nr:hypothetical protein [Tanacetum cinerariifolium]